MAPTLPRVSEWQTPQTIKASAAHPPSPELPHPPPAPRGKPNAFAGSNLSMKPDSGSVATGTKVWSCRIGVKDKASVAVPILPDRRLHSCDGTAMFELRGDIPSSPPRGGGGACELLVLDLGASRLIPPRWAFYPVDEPARRSGEDGIGGRLSGGPMAYQPSVIFLLRKELTPKTVGSSPTLQHGGFTEFARVSAGYVDYESMNTAVELQALPKKCVSRSSRQLSNSGQSPGWIGIPLSR